MLLTLCAAGAGRAQAPQGDRPQPAEPLPWLSEPPRAAAQPLRAGERLRPSRWYDGVRPAHSPSIYILALARGWPLPATVELLAEQQARYTLQHGLQPPPALNSTWPADQPPRPLGRPRARRRRAGRSACVALRRACGRASCAAATLPAAGAPWACAAASGGLAAALQGGRRMRGCQRGRLLRCRQPANAVSTNA